MSKLSTGLQDWREFRRRQALQLCRSGWQQRAIAQALGVTPGAVSQWLAAAAEHGEAALRARLRPGAPAKLSLAQRRLLPARLALGAGAYGFRGEVWTCARVAQVIEREFGVSYHKRHVARLLKALAWTPQKPLQHALQRDEAAIARWRSDVWPALKKRPFASGGN